MIVKNIPWTNEKEELRESLLNHNLDVSEPVAPLQKTLGGGQKSILGPHPALKILKFSNMPLGTVLPLGFAFCSLFRDQKQYQNRTFTV